VGNDSLLARYLDLYFEGGPWLRFTFPSSFQADDNGVINLCHDHFLQCFYYSSYHSSFSITQSLCTKCSKTFQYSSGDTENGRKLTATAPWSGFRPCTYRGKSD
jgi:hypothetical protein